MRFFESTKIPNGVDELKRVHFAIKAPLGAKLGKS